MQLLNNATILAATLSLLTATSSSANGEVTLWKNVDGWDVSFYPGLPGCIASMLYTDGTHFFIGFIKEDKDLLLDVSLMQESWESIEAGKEYSVKAYFGDETPWTLEMTGADYGGTPGLSFAFDAYSDQADIFANEFQRETGMEWFFNNVSIANLTLRGSRVAFQEAIACQRSFHEAFDSATDPFGGGSGNANTDPFSQ